MNPIPEAPTRLLLKPAEAAAALGIGQTHLKDLIARGEIESVKIGKSRRFPYDALQRFVDAKLAESRDAS